MPNLTSSQLRKKFIDFYKHRGHVEIPPAPLIPENDPTTLFTGSGMQPLVVNLLGQPHPLGTRLVDSQPAIRDVDIEEVSDNRHLTFFEMLGNWSLGDYFKQEQLNWIFEFFTQELNLTPQNLYVSVFIGDTQNKIPKDEESIKIWKQIFSQAGIEAKDIELTNEQPGARLGMREERIFAYDIKKNWWNRGEPGEMLTGEPGGPDSEVFYEFTHIKHHPRFGKHCHPNCECGRFLEIGNSVFIQYQKQPDGSLKELPQKNVDFGGGFERILAATQNDPDIFKTDLFSPLISVIENHINNKYSADNRANIRIIADHIKAATFLVGQNLQPSNKQQGYILRRLIRRAVIKMRQLQVKDYSQLSNKLIERVKNIYLDTYQEVEDTQKISQVINQEIYNFTKTLNRGFKQIEKHSQITPQVAFDLFQTYGFPFEITQEIAAEKGQTIDKDEFKKEMEAHQKKSRTAAAGMFKGGLADQSENTIKYHTATHLLHQALQQVLGDHVQQKGSNITGERLRFDFSHPQALTDSEINQVETIINQQITDDLPVTSQTLSYQQALNQGAHSFFTDRYPEKVKVYTIGKSKDDYFSKEICAGPHVKHTGQIGNINIYKQTSAGSQLRRVYAKFADS